MSNLTLNELQHEALIELLNISSGKATAVLSEMLLSEINISVPRLEQTARSIVARQVQATLGEAVTAISMETEGVIACKAMLVLSQHSSFSLTQQLMGDQVPAELLPELESEAMVELGNVILNACLSTFADQFGESIQTSIPTFAQGSASSLIGDDHIEVLFLQVNFVSQAGNEQGHIILILSADEARKISALLDQYLRELMVT
jgi:chemotaxis protein CheC